MFDLSPIQLVLVLVIALLALGPRRLPEVGRTIGRTLRDLRGAMALDDHNRDGAPTGEVEPRTADPPQPADGASPPAGRSVAVGGGDAAAAARADERPGDAGARTGSHSAPALGAQLRESAEGGPSVDELVARGRRRA